MRKGLASVAFLLTAGALLGCGGSSSSVGTGPSARHLTKAQWVSRADAGCRRAVAAIEPLQDQFGRFIGRSDLKKAGFEVRSIVVQLEKNGESLRRLGLPREAAMQAQDFEEKLERTIEQNIDLAEALEAGEASAAARLQVQIHETQEAGLVPAHQIGLTVCGTE